MPGAAAASFTAVAVVAARAALLFFAATFVFDCIHFALHRLAESRFGLLRSVGGLHMVHHEFYDRNLKLQRRARWTNLFLHVLPEYLTQLAVTGSALLWAPPEPVWLAIAAETALCVATLAMLGEDPYHRELAALPVPPPGPVVTAAYHAAHHVFMNSHYGSYTTLFDRLFGTGLQLAGRKVLLTGASGAFGSALRELLEREGAVVRALKYGTDWTYDDLSGAEAALDDAEILVLAHGSKLQEAMRANCDSFVALIERFVAKASGRLVPPEVWALGSEIEVHPAFGKAGLQIYLESKRAFAARARGYYRDPRLVYRHIVPSAFRSAMGPGLMSARTAARIALFFIRRGARYVPVTYTGLAFVNYLRFAFGRPRTRPLAEG